MVHLTGPPLTTLSPVVKRHVESAKSAGTPVPFILLKQNGNVVRQFIECVTSSLSHEIDLPNRGVRDMWDLCVTLRATVIQYVALRALLARPGGTDLLGNFDPWEAFKVAATRDDLELAKLSIKAFDRAIIPISEILTTKPPSFFNGIPPQYVFALMRSAFVQTEYETKKGSNKKKCLGFRSPSEIAEAFCLDD
jgi:hypothetical protein